MVHAVSISLMLFLWCSEYFALIKTIYLYLLCLCACWLHVTLQNAFIWDFLTMIMFVTIFQKWLLIPTVLVIRYSFTCGHKIINVCLHETISVINSMTLVCMCVLQEKVRMRYKLTFILGDQQVTESGEIDKFPPVERWGHL